MVDLKGQYAKKKSEIDDSIQSVINSAQFIKGPVVQDFEANLSQYLGGAYVISCANGTDALQISLMALGFRPGDEIIVPSFTYVAVAEVITILGLKPIMVDVDPDSFNISTNDLEKHVTNQTKAIVPVHLFGQSADMDSIMSFADQYGLYVIEDNAQAIGASHTTSKGSVHKTGTIGHIGCTSFFPSKNLGCYGDGGAIYTLDYDLAEKIRMIANHGQRVKNYHEIVGVNSRLDAIQAAILTVKLGVLDQYSKARQQAANWYDKYLMGIENLIIPQRSSFSTHVFHQYTLKVKNGLRDGLKAHLNDLKIPTMIYYPLPLYKQKAYENFALDIHLPVTEQLCDEVLSLPMHTELTEDTIAYISDQIRTFLEKH